MIRADRLHSYPAGSRPLPRALKGHGVRWQSARTSLRTGAGLSQLSRAVPHARDQPRVKRLPVDGYASSFGGCSAVTHWAGLTLPRPPSTAKIISSVAGRVPLSAQCPAHSEILISQGFNAMRPPRLPEGVRSSGPMSTSPSGSRPRRAETGTASNRRVFRRT